MKTWKKFLGIGDVSIGMWEEDIGKGPVVFTVEDDFSGDYEFEIPLEELERIVREARG